MSNVAPLQINLGGGMPGQRCQSALGNFLYWVSAIVIGQAVYSALLASWQEAGYSNITTQWANCGLLLGVMIVVWMIYCFRNPPEAQR